MHDYPVTVGEAPFDAPNTTKECRTWYKIVGNLEASHCPPLIALHGGPGAGHEYLSSLTDLVQKYGVPVIFYDQMGCGRSTHHRERMGDASFWTFELFIKELDNLIDQLNIRVKGFYLLGQSWGGSLAGMYASGRPRGLRKVVICSGPASIPLAVEGGKRLQAQLPQHIHQVLRKGERDGDLKNPEYEQANEYFYRHHVCRLVPMPKEVTKAFANLADDPTAYHTMQGPSEIVVDGTLKDWDGSEASKNINVEVLLVNGRFDEVTELCIEPWFRCIPKVKWVIFENSSHMAHWEERGRFMEVVGTFLTKY